MPYPSEHAARINDPNKYVDFARVNGGDKDAEKRGNHFGAGIDVIFGIKKDGKSEIQSIRFDKKKFSVADAKKWLKEHDFKPLEFEAATGKSDEIVLEYKNFKFNLIGSEEKKTDEGNFGIIKGYASTFGNIDRGGDVVERGAFVKCLEKYKKEGKLIPMCFQHSMMDIIGGFDTLKMYEDEKGLFFGEGKINLDVSRGRDVYALTKQGVLCETSIGYTINDFSFEKENEGSDYTNRHLKDIELWEISMVAVPMNPQARITDVKNQEIEECETIRTPDIRNICDKEHLPIHERKYLLEKLFRGGILSKAAAKLIVDKFFKTIDSEHIAEGIAEEIDETEGKNKEEIVSSFSVTTISQVEQVQEDLKNISMLLKKESEDERMSKLVKELNALASALRKN